MARNHNDRLQRGNLIQRLHPVFASFVLRNSKVDVIENRVARRHRFERRNGDEAVSSAVALHTAGDRKLLAFKRKRGSRKFLGQHRIGAGNVIAVSGEPELLPSGPPCFSGVDRRRKRDDSGRGERLLQHCEPKQMIGMGVGDVNRSQVLLRLQNLRREPVRFGERELRVDDQHVPVARNHGGVDVVAVGSNAGVNLQLELRLRAGGCGQHKRREK